MIIWHLSWHFVLFLNSKHCFSLNFDFLGTQPFISCEKSAESRLSVRYYLAGVSHYFFEANGSNLIWFCSKGQLKLRHFLLPRYSAINIKSYPSEIINVLCQTCLGGKLEQGELNITIVNPLRWTSYKIEKIWIFLPIILHRFKFLNVIVWGSR